MGESRHWLCAECFFALLPTRPLRAVPGIAGYQCCACGLGPARIPCENDPRRYTYCKYVHPEDT